MTLHPRRLIEALERSRAVVELLVRDELVSAPECSLKGVFFGVNADRDTVRP